MARRWCRLSGRGDGMKRKWRPNLRDRYRYRFQKRSSADGIVAEACAGDREMIKSLANVAAYLMHDRWMKQDNFADYALGLHSILTQIASGVEPNVAWGWKKTSEWVKQRESFETLEKNHALACAVHGYASNFEGKSLAQACQFAAEIYGIDADSLRRKLTSVAGDEPSLSAEQSVNLAIEVVAECGARKYRASESAIRQAYKDYRRQE